MAEVTKEEKTETATGKRRDETRKKGQVAQSKEVATLFIITSSLLLFYFLGNMMVQDCQKTMKDMFLEASYFRAEAGNINAMIAKICYRLVIMVLPFLATIFVVGIGSHLLQTGLLFTWEPIMPKLSKINPAAGIKRLFSKRSLMELGKSVFKILVITYVAYLAMEKEMVYLPRMMEMSAEGILSTIGWSSFRIIRNILGVLLVLAAADYAFQRWDFEKSIKMTKQEVKEEMKQMEGDPQIKSRVRSVQRDLARRRMMEAVPKADVVITNPTSLAIALSYLSSDMKAPKVVAKGSGFVAEKIREIAKSNNVPIVENKPLARAMYEVVEIGDEIPGDFYKAVAEVLAYVYKLKA